MTALPPGRGRWRLTVHRRDYSGNATPATTGVAELTDARSRRLETQANTAAKLTFTMDGRSPSCAYVQELTTDVMAWRYDDTAGHDVLMFRGVVAQSEDQVTEQAYSVNFTCHDYLAMLDRRYLTAAADLVYAQTDQDDIVAGLLARALSVTAAAGSPSFTPGSSLPLALALVNPDGTARAKSGVKRDRTYTGGSSIGQLVHDLAAVRGGFDYDCAPTSATLGHDSLRVFYGAQGITRTDVVLAYGSTVSAFTRTVNSTDYGNYQRVIGDNTAAGTGAPQLIAEAWNTDANNVGQVPIGLWMATDNASDVSQSGTLQEKANGDLDVAGALVPSYTLTMRPDAYRPGVPAMGDTVPLELRIGRLNVATTVRVLGIVYDVTDDDAENVELTVGRPALDLTALFVAASRDADALARR